MKLFNIIRNWFIMTFNKNDYRNNKKYPIDLQKSIIEDYKPCQKKFKKSFHII